MKNHMTNTKNNRWELRIEAVKESFMLAVIAFMLTISGMVFVAAMFGEDIFSDPTPFVNITMCTLTILIFIILKIWKELN